MSSGARSIVLHHLWHGVPPSPSCSTGIKVIDVLMPLERGGKAGLFGGAGAGKMVLLTESVSFTKSRSKK